MTEALYYCAFMVCDHNTIYCFLFISLLSNNFGGNNTLLDDNYCAALLRCRELLETEDQLEDFSFLPIRNFLHDLSFSWCSRNIYGVTAAKNMRVVLLGLYKYTVQ